MLHRPEALYSGVLHDGAWGEAKVVGQVVRWSPLILLRLAVLSTQALPAESLDSQLNLTGRQTV